MRATIRRSAELVLVAHGTRNTAGLRTIGEIAAAVSRHVGPVRTAFVDVLGPNPGNSWPNRGGRPWWCRPSWLPATTSTQTFRPRHRAGTRRDRHAGHGPSPALAQVMRERLVEVGWRHGDAVVMAAAGSSDPVAHSDLIKAAALLSDRVGETHIGFVATGAPVVADVVDRLRRSGHRRVFIASYLLAPGVFHSKLHNCGATAVADPLGAHTEVVRLLVGRFTAAMAPVFRWRSDMRCDPVLPLRACR